VKVEEYGRGYSRIISRRHVYDIISHNAVNNKRFIKGLLGLRDIQGERKQ